MGQLQFQGHHLQTLTKPHFSDSLHHPIPITCFSHRPSLTLTFPHSLSTPSPLPPNPSASISAIPQPPSDLACSANPPAQMSWDWRKILEVLILGQFVIDKCLLVLWLSDYLVGYDIILGYGSCPSFYRISRPLRFLFDECQSHCTSLRGSCWRISSMASW